jgi:hypothetical protein
VQILIVVAKTNLYQRSSGLDGLDPGIYEEVQEKSTCVESDDKVRWE